MEAQLRRKCHFFHNWIDLSASFRGGFNWDELKVCTKCEWFRREYFAGGQLNRAYYPPGSFVEKLFWVSAD